MNETMNVSFLNICEMHEQHIAPITNQVELLRDIFFSRFNYKDDEIWIREVGTQLVSLCAEAGEDRHYMYPVEEFVKSYVNNQ